MLLATIPRTARVNKKELKAPDVVYSGGKPELKPIEGSKGVQQVVNTDKDIVKYGDLYYMCFQGVWFMSRAADGPVGSGLDHPAGDLHDSRELAGESRHLRDRRRRR